MALSYFYFNERQPGKPQTDLLIFVEPRLNPLPDVRNPIFNFSQDFIDKFNAVSPVRLAKALPYVSIQALDLDGNVKIDYNVQFFNKTVDMTKVNAQARYADRPDISLQNLAISQDLAAGGGFLSYTNVTMQFRLHKPDYITQNALLALLFPGMPIRITYGWAATDAKDDFLGANDVLSFAVVDYAIGFDAAGQGILTVNGMDYGSNFANIFIGDNAQKITEDDVKKIAQKTDVTDAQQDNLWQRKLHVGQYVSYINSLSSRNDGGKRDLAVVDAMTQAYYDVSQRVSDATEKQFELAMDNLAKKRQSRPEYFKDVKRKDKEGRTHYAECVLLHDVISVLCGETLEALQGSVIPANRDYRIVYGCFNDNLADWSGKCLAEFPIHWQTLQGLINQNKKNSNVPSLQWLLAKLKDNFLSDTSYWRDNILKSDDQDDIDFPSCTCHVSSHFSNATFDSERREIIQIAFFDVNHKVPLTQLQLRDIPNPTSEAAQIAACIGDPPAVPVIRLGNANSIIKSINMESFTDPAFKAMLMNASMQTVSTVRQSLVSDADSPPNVQRPPFIPFKGSMQVMGHVDWKPARFFYLASGIFFIDGIYSILAVHHELDATGFKTRIEFTRH